MTGPGAGADHGLVRAPELRVAVTERERQSGLGDRTTPTTTGHQDAESPATDHLLTEPRADPGGGAPPSNGPRSLLRSALAAVAGVLIGVAAVLLTRNGIRTDDFPPFLDGTSATPITRYSGPWLTAGAAAALIAALLLLLSVIDGWRWLRHRRSAITPHAAGRVSADVIGPTSS